MTARPERALLLFLDGVGIGASDAAVNPFLRARLPTLAALFGGSIPVLDRLPAPTAGDGTATWTAADATLGLPGRPQSGTGQTTLLTGENCAREFGRHFGPWVPTVLRPLLAERNLLTRTARAGRSIAFANATPASALANLAGKRRPSAPPLAAQAAGVLDRHEAELRSGRAVASSITHEAWQRYLPDLPAIAPAAAGAALAGIVQQADLTLFAHYDTDLVGHTRDPAAAVEVLERVDGFLGGLLDALPGDALLVVASDHGNVEDLSTGHTTNPVPVIAAGPGATEMVRGVRSIADVTPELMRLLAVT